MTDCPYPKRFRGRISWPRPVIVTGDLEPVMDEHGVIQYWLVYTADRELPTKVPAAGASIEPVYFSSDVPRGQKRGR